jgi:hypothetical protein
MSSDLLDPSVLKIFNHEEMRTNDEVEHALQVIANVDHTVWKLVVQECLERSLALEFVWTGQRPVVSPLLISHDSFLCRHIRGGLRAPNA